jgi:anti-anti-sigma regulatory factor
MSLSTRPRLLAVEQAGDVTVVTLLHPEILSTATIELVGRQLLAVVGEESNRQVLLDFRKVVRLSTPLIGKVLELHARLRQGGGRVALCSVAPDLYVAFDLLRLPRLLPFYRTREKALRRLGSPRVREP